MDEVRQPCERPAAGQAGIRALDHMAATALFCPAGRLLHINPRFALLYGIDPARISGLKRTDIVARDGEAQLAHRQLWAALRGGQSQNATYLAVRGDGAEILIEGTFMPR